MSTPQGAAPAEQPKSGKRARMMLLLALVILIAAVGYGFYYFTYARYHEDTDDAYVNGNVVQITPQVVGTVVAVNADDTQTVQIGQPVVVLDAADSKIALQNAEATLAQTVRQVRTLYVNNNAYQADVQQRQADLARAQDDLKRRLAVAQTGAVSLEEISHAKDSVKVAQAALIASEQNLASNRALTERTTIAGHPNVMAAASKVRDAYLNFARNTLPAPVTGYVAKRSVQVGQRVSPGTPLMAVVPLNGVWVDANFKEVQLKNMRIGQPAELTADVYGSSVVYHGKVVGFSAGTGSAFSLLPAQNATGNWIKVVQRLPVRIELDPKELEAHPLRIGLSMQVNVDVKGSNGSQLGNAKNTVYETDVFAKYGEQADQEIARIIAENTGSTSLATK
ncbi:multidrug efflux pump membrane fusion protein EmrA [Pararobbsia alpina]|uniref:HlyD family secretion protein n=1 Tax=Pararobbsia alpina TaxID=621374 RepID=UPI0039A50BFF